VQELTLRNIDSLLVAYKQSAAAKQSEHLRHYWSHAADGVDKALLGCFSHCSSRSLTLENVKSLLNEYQRELKSVG